MFIHKNSAFQRDSNWVACSGFFDPLHVGHIEYFKEASQYGNVIVIVNSDAQARMKKGKPFMPVLERMKIVSELKYVQDVIEAIDEDITVCKTLELIRPKFFIKTADRKLLDGSLPEFSCCTKMGIKMIDGKGQKVQSSSKLVKDYSKQSNSYHDVEEFYKD